MAIRRENNGTYTVDVSQGYLKNGKRNRPRKKGIKTYKEAKKIEACYIQQEKRENQKKESTLFQDVHKKYMGDCLLKLQKGLLKENTIGRKISDSKLHILPFFKGYDITKITSKDIKDFQQEIMQYRSKRKPYNKLGNSALSEIYKELKAFFNYCVNEDILEKSPCKTVKGFKKEKANKDFLTIEEFYSMINQVNDYTDYVMLHTLYFTGVRVSELLGLNLAQLHLDDDIPYIAIKDTCSSGKLHHYTKTDESEDIVPLDKDTCDTIRKYINSDEFKARNSIYLFASTYSNSKSGIVSTSTVNSKIKNYCNLANIEKKITSHNFRHSNAVMLLEMGMTLEDVKRRLRHKSIVTTSNEYAHMSTARQLYITSEIEKRQEETKKILSLS